MVGDFSRNMHCIAQLIVSILSDISVLFLFTTRVNADVETLPTTDAVEHLHYARISSFSEDKIL